MFYFFNLLITLMVCLLTILPPALSEASPSEIKNKTIIFLVDTSGSMRKEGLFNRVKRSLKEYVRQREIGDRILIITFDEQVKTIVENTEIKTQGDVSTICESIDRLEAKGSWTWMSQALRQLRQRGEDLKKAYPERDMIIYFLTDGVNDPPPKVDEPRLEFIEVLVQYFGNFRVENTYVYLLCYRSITEEEMAEMPSQITPIPIPPEEEPLVSVEIEPTELNLGKIDRSKGVFELQGEITVTKVFQAQGKRIGLNLVSEAISPSTSETALSLPREMALSPDSFVCQAEGQKVTLDFSLPPSIEVGHYQGFLELHSMDIPPVSISPIKIRIEFTVEEVIAKEKKAIYLGPLKIVLGKIVLVEDKLVKKYDLHIKKLLNSENKVIHLNSTLSGVEIFPKNIQCDKEGKKEIQIIFSPDLAPGKRFAEIEISCDDPEVIIKPQKIPIHFVIPEEEERGNGETLLHKYLKLLKLLTKAFLLLATLGALLIGWLAFQRNKVVWVKREDTQKVKEVKVKGWTKCNIEGIGLPDCYLKFEKFGKLIILGIKKNGKEEKVQYQQKIDCKLPEGKKVSVIVSDKPFDTIST